MSISSGELIDNLIAGNLKTFSPHTMRMMEVIERGQEVILNDVALNDPEQLSVAIFNYPLVKDHLYKEFADAAKRISSAKYAYYKKSATFKENFTKLCTETFNKHHKSDMSLSHSEQIQKVKSAIKVVKFIGELYVVDFFVNCNIAHFLEVLSNNIIESKVSEDCLQCLISIISNRVKNEVKLYKHNVHMSAIVNLISEYENETSKLKKNYKDFEIIDAVNKTIKNKSMKSTHSRNTKDSTKIETMKQSRRIFETILSGNVQLSVCLQHAYDISIIYPDSFENEMLQLCVDYLRKCFETSDEALRTKCLDILKFLGVLYNNEVVTSDGVKGMITFLMKFDESFSHQLINLLLNEIYDKIMELDDHVLKSVVPKDFERQSNKNKVEEAEAKNMNEEIEIMELPSSRKNSNSESISNGNVITSDSTGSAQNNYSEPVEKFRDLLTRLSPTNVAYILREISQIKFAMTEDTIKELSTILVDHAINKHKIIKAIAQVSRKLPETVVPNFNMSLMKKHLKAHIYINIFGCSEREAIGYVQLVKELHQVNYYDKFDIVILMDNFIEYFDQDRTALITLLKFINEFREVLVGKKLSKNIKQKLANISLKLTAVVDEESDVSLKENIDSAIKILRNEDKTPEESPSPKRLSQDFTVEDSSIQKSAAIDERQNSSPLPVHLPPMSVPPPKMLLPPPALPIGFKPTPTSDSSATSSASSTVHEMKYNKNDTLLKVQQLCFKNYRKTKCDGDLINRQSSYASSSTTSSCENSIESDDFYDIASDFNIENLPYDAKHEIESESAYSSLEMGDFLSPEDNFKNAIKKQFIENSKSIDEFTAMFIKRGMNCKNSGYIHLVDDIKNSLTDNMDIFNDFIDKLDKKFLESIQNLKKSDQNLSTSEKKNSLQLILMTGEFYNTGHMKNQTFLACLEKLLNDIGSEHQITLFHQLIKISMDKIIQNGIARACKTFLDILAQRVSSIIDENDRHLIAHELYVTLKILHYRYYKAQIQCPVKNFKIFLQQINTSDETLITNLNRIKNDYVYKKQHLAEIVELFLQTAVSNDNTKVYVKSAYALKSLTALDNDGFTFKTHVEFKLHDTIKKLLEDTNNESKMIDLYKTTCFVADLFVDNVASIYLVLCTLEMLLVKEIECKNIIDCIKIFLQKVGLKIDQESVYVLDKFFLFFKQVVKQDQGYRKIIYKELIELRGKNWDRTDNEKSMEMIEEYFGKIINTNVIKLSFLICEILSKSSELTEMFLQRLWKILLINPESTHLYVKLSVAISNYNREFKTHLMAFMRQRNKTFKIICQEQKVPESLSNKLSTVISFMGYLYAYNYCDDDDIKLWILPEFIRHLNMIQCDEINLIIGKKVKESQNNEMLKALMILVEYHSYESLFRTIKSVKNSLNELINYNS